MLDTGEAQGAVLSPQARALFRDALRDAQLLIDTDPAAAVVRLQALVGQQPHEKGRTQLGRALAKAGRGEEAVALVGGMLASAETALPFQELAKIQDALGRPAAVIDTCRLGLARFPEDKRLNHALTRALVAAGWYSEAKTHAGEVERLAGTGNVDLGFVAASAWRRLGDPGRAAAVCERLLAARPEHKALLQEYAWSLFALSRLDEALAAMATAARLAPDDRVRQAAHLRLGILAGRLSGLAADAVALVAQVDHGLPVDVVQVLFDYALGTGDDDLAGRAFARLIAAVAGDPVAARQLCAQLALHGAPDYARQLIAAVLKTRPDANLALLDITMHPGPQASVAAIEVWRVGLVDRLTRFEAPVPLDLEYLRAGQHLLTFQIMFAGGVTAERAWAWHDAVKRVAPARPAQLRHAPSRRSGSRIRVGVLGGERNPLARDALLALDPEQFEPVLAFWDTVGADDAAAAARAGAEAVALSRHTGEACAALAALQLDVLMISELRAVGLTHERLAPTQVLWVEPAFDDGLEGADYYLSWADAEPTDWQRTYLTAPAFTERPPYWLSDEFIPVAPRSRAHFPLPADRRWYVCPSLPLKVTIDFDAAAIGILDADPQAIVVTLRAHNIHAHRNRQRLVRARPDLAERVFLLPYLPAGDCHALLQLADCVIDSIPIGGMSSAFMTAALGIAKVTTERDIPYGKWNAALYRRVGVPELIAPTIDCYVELALELAHDPASRAQLGAVLADRTRLLMRDRAAIAEIEAFLVAAVARAGQRPLPWLKGAFVG